ncbi:MAG: hypothetical protein GC180_04140 [Bacteroidetes bacterium]|nr:hypothetical protein [Bacteroidota bacterium]
MTEPGHDFQIGDPIRAKDSDLKGRVIKILDAGYLMILDLEFDMELNLHHSEIVKDELDPSRIISHNSPKDSIAKNIPRSLCVDLHQEKLPSTYRNTMPVLQGQLDYSQDRLLYCLHSGCKEVLFIHGKGSGALHQRLLNLLKGFPQIQSIEIQKVAFEKPHGIRVLFK